MKIDLPNNLGVHPNPVAMISSGDMEHSNIATIAWTGIINSEPMIVYVSIRQSRLSHEIITNAKEFVINLPDVKLVKEADFCGTKSGRDVDKFVVAKLTKGQSLKVASPYIEECPINLECKVSNIRKFPSHDMFIAEVVHTRCDSEILDESGNVDFTKANLITFAGKKYFVNNEEIGYRGCRCSVGADATFCPR